MAPESNDSSNTTHVRLPSFKGDRVGRSPEEESDFDPDFPGNTYRLNEKSPIKENIPGNVTISGYVVPEYRFLPEGVLQNPIRATSLDKRSPNTRWGMYRTEEPAEVYRGKIGIIPKGSPISAPSKNVKKDKEKQPK